MNRKFFTLILSVFALGLMAQAPTVYLSGTFNSWAVADPLYQLTDNGNTVLHIAKELPAGTHQFKLTDGTWDKSIAVSRTITLAATTTIHLYARGSKSFVCDTQDTIYLTGNATGSNAWGASNMVKLTLNGQKATVKTTIIDWGQGNMYRITPGTVADPLWQEQVWSKPDYSGGNFILYETTGAIRTVTFDFATYVLSLDPQERFDMAYTLDGTTWKTAAFIDDPNNADLLKLNLTLPADIAPVQYAVKYSQDGVTYPANIDGFTSVKNINILSGVTAGVQNTFQVSRSSTNVNFDFAVTANTAVNDVKNSIKYAVYNNQIIVNADNSVVDIYAVSGQRLATSNVNGTYTYTAPHAGVYILRSKGASYKVVIK